MITKNYYSLLCAATVAENAPMLAYDGKKYYAGIYTSAVKPITDWLRLCSTAKTFSDVSELSQLTSSGVVFGSDNTPASLDDYAVSLVGNLSCLISDSREASDDGGVCTITYTVTNNNAEAITISEIGIFAHVFAFKEVGESLGKYGPFLLERTVLESPITIEPGGVGQVTYTIRMNYPTA